MATLTIADLDNGKRDLQTVSEVANSRAATATTRFGQQTTTLYESIRRINAAGDEILSNLGFRVPVDYAPSLNVTDSRFTVTGPDGKVYAPLSAPFTTGAWDPSQWYVLQNDLNDKKLLVFGSRLEAESAATVLPDGQPIVWLGSDYEFSVQSGNLKPVAPSSWGLNRSLDNYLSSQTRTPEDVSAAVIAMANDVGYVNFAFSEYPINSLTISVPCYFGPGAYLSASPGQTIVFSSSVNSTEQWILRGQGSYKFQHDDSINVGEYSRQVHISWFGCFPEPNPTVVPDHAPYFNTAYQSFGNVREGIIQMDMGTYYLKTPVQTTRGVHLRGKGTRRTAIRAAANSFDLFTTGNTACRFSEFGFENYGSLVRSSGCYINIAHSSCEIYNINLPTAKNGIISTGSDLRIKNIIGSFTQSFPESSIIKIEGGSSISIEGISFSSSSNFGPSFIVDITNRDSSGGIGAVSLSDVRTTLPSPVVNIEAKNGNISQVNISDIIGSAFSGANPDALINISSSGTFFVKLVTILSAQCNSFYSRFLRMRLSGTSTIESVTVAGCLADGGTGVTGVEIEGVAGTTAKSIRFSSSFINNREFDYNFSNMAGGLVGVKVDPGARASTNPAICHGAVIADQSAIQIPLTRAVNNGFLLVSAGYQNYSMLAVRAASSPQASVINASANVGVLLTPLTGTTGPSGKLTVGVTNGNIYVENRLGSSQSVTVVLMTGVL